MGEGWPGRETVARALFTPLARRTWPRMTDAEVEAEWQRQERPQHFRGLRDLATAQADAVLALYAEVQRRGVEELVVCREIGDSFWRALKPLRLQALNVADPGSHFTEALATATARGWAEGIDAAALKAQAWADSKSCTHHDDNPCCHVRTGAGIAAAIRAMERA